MLNSKKKIFRISFMFMTVLCSACGGTAGSGEVSEKNDLDKSGKASAVMEGTVEIDENLPDRDIVIPEYLMKAYESTSGQTEPSGENMYHMTGEEQAGAAREIAEQIEDSINQVLTDKDFYPDIVGISVNPECTEFNVTFSGRELSLYENTLRVSLCIVGDRFQLYQGKGEDELLTVVNYIDADSGEIFSTMNSREIE